MCLVCVYFLMSASFRGGPSALCKRSSVVVLSIINSSLTCDSCFIKSSYFLKKSNADLEKTLAHVFSFIVSDSSNSFERLSST